ncbi:MAG: hypothetical protein WDW38_004255 [Sanguina aurantia]
MNRRCRKASAACLHGRPLTGAVLAGVDLFAAALARKAFGLIKEEDQEDLYFDKGLHMTAFFTALRGGSSTMSLPFFEAMVDAAVTEPDGVAWGRILTLGLKEFGKPDTQLKDVNQLQPAIQLLGALTTPFKLQRCLASLLLSEVIKHGGGKAGGGVKAFESSSILTSLLGISSLVSPTSVLRQDLVSQAKEGFLAIRGYPNTTESESFKNLLRGVFGRLHDAGFEVMNRLLKAKDGAVCREVLLSWLSMVAALNMERTKFGERSTRMDQRELAAGCGEGFMVNTVALCLKLCNPFINDHLLQHNRDNTAPAKFKALEKLTADYYLLNPHRVGSMQAIATLAGERGTGAAGTALEGVSGFLSPKGLSTVFIPDIFFITQKLVHVGLITALHRFTSLYSHLLKAEEGSVEESESSKRGPRPRSLNVTLLWDCSSTALFDPRLADDMARFALFTLDWLSTLARTPTAVASFRCIPEYVLSDALTWLSALIDYRQPEIVASKPVGLLIDSLPVLSGAGVCPSSPLAGDSPDSPTCVRSPLIHNKIVTLLMSMMAPQLATSRGRLGRGHLSPGQSALVAAVLGTPAAQTQLLPALMRAYVGADYVVGLDVDTDNFDKFGMRSHIDRMFNELWQDSKIKESFRQLALAGSSTSALAASASTSAAAAAASVSCADVFSDYISTLLNGLLYLFKDSLDRLADINKIESSKANAAAWDAMPAAERDDKTRFYEGQRKTASGFLPMAVEALDWLITLTRDTSMTAAFLLQPVCSRAAYGCITFVDLLVGPSCAQLKVETPERYGFDLPVLMEKVLGLMLQLATHREFVNAISEEPDFDLQVFETALQLCEDQHQPQLALRLSHLLAQLRPPTPPPVTSTPPPSSSSAAAAAAATAAAAAAAAGGSNGTPPPAKRLKSPVSSDGVDGVGATSEPASAAAADAADLEMDEAADASSPCASLGLALPGDALLGQQLEGVYQQALGGLGVGTFNALLPGSYSRQLAAQAEASTGAHSAQVVFAQRAAASDAAARIQIQTRISARSLLRAHPTRSRLQRLSHALSSLPYPSLQPRSPPTPCPSLQPRSASNPASFPPTQICFKTLLLALQPLSSPNIPPAHARKPTRNVSQAGVSRSDRRVSPLPLPPVSSHSQASEPHSLWCTSSLTFGSSATRAPPSPSPFLPPSNAPSPPLSSLLPPLALTTQTLPAGWFAKSRRLAKELRALQGATSLPCAAAASIFLRHDETRLDKMRVVITGPEGTPYESGLFLFDAFFPAGYPNVAPLLTMQNTGGGRGRYNPNLYADGKVCLSLLGTWHSSHASEKWNPASSTLFQVVMSIQGQVLVEDPYFNEPNNESVSATSEGKEMSLRYNGEVQLHVMRYAMMDLLKRPQPGLESVVSSHFRLLRHRILATCQRWVREAGWKPQLQQRLDAALVELTALLAAL